ncbi:MAG: Imm1 family immunity protein [archaeon]
MFISKIIEKNSNKDKGDAEKACTEMIMVKEAIERLKGHEDKTVVVLEKDSKNYMLVGGGKDGKYIVTALSKGKKYVAANKYAVPKPEVELFIEGKTESYPAKRVLNLEMTLEAAKQYAHRGALAQVFDWEVI